MILLVAKSFIFISLHCFICKKFWRWSNLSQQHPTCRNTTQHGGQTRATCCAQQCCDMLRWHVAIVWLGLNGHFWRCMSKHTKRQINEHCLTCVLLPCLYTFRFWNKWFFLLFFCLNLKTINHKEYFRDPTIYLKFIFKDTCYKSPCLTVNVQNKYRC